jgi:hypothetical protein
MPLEYCVSNSPRSIWKFGNSINVSASGVLITTEECLSVGSVLDIAMNWPSVFQGKPTVRLFMIGRVPQTFRATAGAAEQRRNGEARNEMICAAKTQILPRAEVAKP